MSVNAELEYPLHNCRRFFIDNPVEMILRVFLVSVDGMVGGRFTGFSPCLDRCDLLAAAISQIPFVHDIQKRCKLAGTLIKAVHAVADSNKTDTLFSKQHFRVKAGLQIISANSGHILHQHSADLTSFNICQQLFPTGSVKVATGVTIIRIMDTVFEAVLGGIFLQHFFLIDDGVAVARQFVITGEPLI